MKNKFPYILLVLLLLSCGEDKQLSVEEIAFEEVMASESLDTLISKKNELYQKQQLITQQLNQLNDKGKVLINVAFVFPLN